MPQSYSDDMAQEEIRRSIDFLKRYLKKHSFLKTFVLGISGGQDSTLAGRLAQLAMEEMRAETGDDSYKFIAVRLPYGVQADEADSLIFTTRLTSGWIKARAFWASASSACTP